MNTEEYLFYEWLILAKSVTSDQFADMSEEKFKELLEEYHSFRATLN